MEHGYKNDCFLIEDSVFPIKQQKIFNLNLKVLYRDSILNVSYQK